MTTQDELHNQLAGEILRTIVKPVLEAGGEMSAVLALAESVLLGVMITAEKLGGYDEAALDLMVAQVKKRWREQRLKPN
jgi:hypothetical protein